jgi:beta-lactamase superfamily II metal-dependent hydrolase
LINFFGIKLTILSPDKKAMQKLMRDWQSKEIKIITKKASAYKKSPNNDYDIKLDDFDLTTFEPDDSISNESSISFLLEYNHRKILFTADASPKILENALMDLGYSPTNKLFLDYMQIPHHGSKFNLSNEVINLIECHNFIISADGYKDNLPNKKTIARIIRAYSAGNINLFITENNAATRSIFNVDEKLENITVHFPSADSNMLIFNL